MKFSACRAITGAAGLAVLGSLVLAPGSAGAAPVSATYDCRATPPLMAPQYATQTVEADVVAPTSVAPRTPFDVVISSGPQTVPSEQNGYTLKEIRDVTVRIPVPANSTFVGATIAGDVPGGTPTWSVSGGHVVVKVPGPIPAGATYQVPTVTATLKSGSRGVIETYLGGTSYDNPGLTFRAIVDAGFAVSVPVSCFPDPNPVLTTTTIAR